MVKMKFVLLLAISGREEWQQSSTHQALTVPKVIKESLQLLLCLGAATQPALKQRMKPVRNSGEWLVVVATNISAQLAVARVALDVKC